MEKNNKDEDKLMLWTFLYDALERNDLDDVKKFLQVYSKMMIKEQIESLRETMSEDEINKMLPKSLKEGDLSDKKRR